MQFEMKQLVAFIAVAEHASFSKAAGALGMAQASISERIGNLEQAVGARLLDRLGRKVSLTAPGELLLARAREIVALQAQAAREIKRLLGSMQGEIAVGGSTAPGEHFLPAVLGRFLCSHPEVRVRMRVADSGDILERIEAGEIELGVVGEREARPNLAYARAWRDEIVLAARPDHPWARLRRPPTPAELAAGRWIVRELGSATRTLGDRYLARALGRRAARPTIAAELGSVTAIKEGVRAGLGVALLSSATIADELASGSLVEVRAPGLPLERRFHLVRDQRRAETPAAAALWKQIVAESR
jgi:DNA-binding transcriptional LysR family regulator